MANSTDTNDRAIRDIRNNRIRACPDCQSALDDVPVPDEIINWIEDSTANVEIVNMRIEKLYRWARKAIEGAERKAKLDGYKLGRAERPAPETNPEVVEVAGRYEVIGNWDQHFGSFEDEMSAEAVCQSVNSVAHAYWRRGRAAAIDEAIAVLRKWHRPDWGGFKELEQLKQEKRDD